MKRATARSTDVSSSVWTCVEPDVADPAFGERVDDSSHQRGTEPAPTRVRSDVEVDDVTEAGRLVRHGREHEPDRGSVVLGHEAEAVLDMAAEVAPRVRPRDPQEGRSANLLLVRAPELA